ncbi:MAG: MoaD/ThiS family protein [Granulosicoccus sp.]|nr:MoaD/ThiS family protein [Granulosicoccus sp.]
MNQSESVIEIEGPISIAEVWHMLTDDTPPENLLCSRNQQHAQWDDIAGDGDEIGFFPPVTGG